MIVQLCGLSGAGKTTLAVNVKIKLVKAQIAAEIIDGDWYRKTLCSDLGFSKQDRIENIRRLGSIANALSFQGVVAIISAINPYRQARDELKSIYKNVKTVYVNCPVDMLIARDTKGLYKRALLPDNHPEKIANLTGVNAPFEAPENADLCIDTGAGNIESSVNEFFNFIIQSLQQPGKNQLLISYPASVYNYVDL